MDMRRLLSAVGLFIIGASAFAANPSFNSFDPNYFGTNANNITIKTGGLGVTVTNLSIIQTNSPVATNNQVILSGFGTADVNSTYTFRGKSGIAFIFTNSVGDVVRFTSSLTGAGVVSNTAIQLYTWSGDIVNNTFTTTGGSNPTGTAIWAPIYATNSAWFFFGTNGISRINTNNPKVLNVDASLGNNALGSKATGYPWRTIAGAMSNAVYGDTLLVYPGTYTDLFTVSNGVSIVGIDRQTVILTNASSGVVFFTLKTNASLQNLTFRTPIDVGPSNTIADCTFNTLGGVDCLLVTTAGAQSWGGSVFRNLIMSSGFDCVNNQVTTDFSTVDFFDCSAYSDGGGTSPARGIVLGNSGVRWHGGSVEIKNSSTYNACFVLGGNGGGTNAQLVLDGGVKTTFPAGGYAVYWDGCTNCSVNMSQPLVAYDAMNTFAAETNGGTFSVSGSVSSFRSNKVAVASFTFPATTVNWTNPINQPIQLYIDNSGVVGTAFKKNGTTIFTTITNTISIGLQPGEYFSQTYTGGSPVGKWSPFP